MNINTTETEQLVQNLSSFNYQERMTALSTLQNLAINNQEELQNVNMHFHSFYSYNAEFWSPVRIADYEGSDHTEAFPIGAFRTWWSSGRYVELTGARSSGSAARFAANLLDSDRFEILEMGPIMQYRVKRDDVSTKARRK